MLQMLPMLSQFVALAGFSIDLPQWSFENFYTIRKGNVADINCDVRVQMGNEQPEWYTAFFAWNGLAVNSLLAIWSKAC